MRTIDTSAKARAALRVFAALFLLVSLMPAARAQQTERAKNLGKRMMCVCGCNQILTECNHVGCTYSYKMLKELDERVPSNQVIEWTQVHRLRRCILGVRRDEVVAALCGAEVIGHARVEFNVRESDIDDDPMPVLTFKRRQHLEQAVILRATDEREMEFPHGGYGISIPPQMFSA